MSRIGNQPISVPTGPDKVKSTHGMDITFVTSAGEDEEARELLKLMGMPFATGN